MHAHSSGANHVGHDGDHLESIGARLDRASKKTLEVALIAPLTVGSLGLLAAWGGAKKVQSGVEKAHATFDLLATDPVTGATGSDRVRNAASDTVALTKLVAEEAARKLHRPEKFPSEKPKRGFGLLSAFGAVEWTKAHAMTVVAGDELGSTIIDFASARYAVPTRGSSSETRIGSGSDIPIQAGTKDTIEDFSALSNTTYNQAQESTALRLHANEASQDPPTHISDIAEAGTSEWTI